MRMPFVKITAQGNDYVYFDLRKENPGYNWSDVSIRVSNRHFGIGSDGIVLLENSDSADVKMRMFNADGSEGRMCGSALRSIIFLLSKEIKKDIYIVETLSGIRRGWIEKIGDEDMVTVEMGKAEFLSRSKSEEEQLIMVDLGNFHQVRYLSNIDGFDLRKRMSTLLKQYENENWNYEFIEIDTPNMIRMRVWENGSGATLACGTGATASVAAGWDAGLLKQSRIKVIMPGGSVYIDKSNGELLLTGKVVEVFKGELIDSELAG